MHVFLNRNHYYFITFGIISTLTKFLSIFKISFNSFLSCIQDMVLYICLFQNIIFAFMPEEDFGIKLKASK